MIDKIKSLIKSKPYIQIGANIGNDVFTTICKETSPTQIVLVEPFEECHNSLRECYKDATYPVAYECVAIVDSDVKEVVLYSATGHKEHASITPLQDWSDDIILKAKACTINELFKKYNLTDIGILFIDTEGNDARIIESIDFANVNIDIIVYEDWSFDVDWFKHDHKLNGKRGMDYTKTKLENLGYTHTMFNIPELTHVAYKNE